MNIIEGNNIDKQQWNALANSSPVATWFQTLEAFDFFSTLSFLEAFAYGIESFGKLKGIIVGFIQKEGGTLKQFFTRRAVVNGGPLLAYDITEEELERLLLYVTSKLKKRAIYIEFRNYNDYSKWTTSFHQVGFRYEPHLNFHLDSSSLENAKARIGKHRWKYIRTSLRNGAVLISDPSLEQVRSFYSLLRDLYKRKIRTPLFPIEFFENLYLTNLGRFFLVGFGGKVIGGSVCVSLNNKALYEWFVCGDDSYKKGVRPSSLATWFGIEYACLNDYPVFDFMGAGKPNIKYGVRDFKAEFGGNLVEYGRFKYICNKPLYQLGVLGVKLLKLLK